MRAAFEHLTGRVVMGLEEIKAKDPEAVKSITSIVVSGGVAANGYLRHM
jgi:N6-L-threonylcarbamoyladenine synthase